MVRKEDYSYRIRKRACPWEHLEKQPGNAPVKLLALVKKNGLVSGFVKSRICSDSALRDREFIGFDLTRDLRHGC